MVRPNVEVQSGDQCANLPLLVVQGEGSNLLGRDWLLHLRLDWKQIHNLKHTVSVEKILEGHEAVFKEGLGTLKTFKAKIYVDPDVRPIYCKARSVPYSMRVKVEEELDRLVQEGVLEPVQFAEWAAPIVPVVKPDKSVRVC